MAKRERNSVAEQNYKLFDSLRKRFGGGKVSDTMATPPADHRHKAHSLSRPSKKLSAPPLVSLIDSSDKMQQSLYSSPTRTRVYSPTTRTRVYGGKGSAAAPPLATVKKTSQPNLQPQGKTSPPEQRSLRRACVSVDDILETSSVASSSSSQDHAYFSSKTSTGSLTPPEEEPVKVLRPKLRRSMTEDIDEGYEEKEIDKQVKSWDRQIGQWMFDGIKPGYSPQTERALRLSPEVRVPISEDVYEMAQNSPKSESWRRSLKKYTPGRFISDDKVTQEEPVFPAVFDDDDDDVKTVTKLRRSKSFHAKHTVTIPPRPSSASSVPMRTSVDSSAISPLAKVQAKPRPHSAATTPLPNTSENPVRSAMPTKASVTATPLQNSVTPTGSPVKSATPTKAHTVTATPLHNSATPTGSPVSSATLTKDNVTTPISSEEANVVNKPQAVGNASSVTPPVVGSLVQEKAKLFGATTHVKRSQSLLVRNYQRPVKYLQRNDKFVPAANPTATSPTAIKNTASPQAVTTNPPTSETTGSVGHSSVKGPTSPVDIPWQAAMIDSEGIPWQARAAGNSYK